jgi:hypothetical protein
MLNKVYFHPLHHANRIIHMQITLTLKLPHAET